MAGKIEAFFKCDLIPIPHSWDMDEIYLLLLSKHKKIMFENGNYNDEMISKVEGSELNWQDPQKLKQSFDPVIRGLLAAKKQYEINKKKKEEKERERKEKAAAAAQRRRAAAARRKNQEVMPRLERAEDSEEDDIDLKQEESDGFQSNSYRRNHNVKVCTHSPFFHFSIFSCSTSFFFVVKYREQMMQNQRLMMQLWIEMKL